MSMFLAFLKAFPKMFDAIEAVIGFISKIVDKKQKRKRHEQTEETSKNPDRQAAARNANDIFRKL